ncbi:MAG: flippase-like domain-containing protein [Chitinophagaceae bacterium]|nr:flippase-like domain-containing protein [Chitinophagaceae bacterium]
MHSRKLKIFLNYFIGPILFVWLSFSIYHQISTQGDVKESWQLIKAAFQGESIWKLMVVAILMLLNWGIEARKWQILVSRVELISYGAAYRAILSGQAFALNTLNGSGDFVGRILYLHEGNRLRAVALSLVGSMSQSLITLIMGFVALIAFRFGILKEIHALEGLNQFWLDGLLIAMVIAIVLFSVLYFNINLFIKFIERIPFIARFKFFIEKLEALHWRELTRILLLSFVRYTVFIVQYILLLQVFGVKAGILNLVMMIAVFFLVLTMVPSITLADLGFRGKVSLQLFGLLSTNHLGIIATAAGIWIVNLIIPAIAGSVLILGVKLFNNKQIKKE